MTIEEELQSVAVRDSDVDRAKNLFRFLAEVKKLSSPTIKDYDNYDQVIWLSDIPREEGCYTKAWNLIGQPAEVSRDYWIEIKKPLLSAPPELPDGLDVFINEKEWRDSSCEVPSLLDVSREHLIRHFLPDEDAGTEYKNISINENDDVFEAYVNYVDEHWQPWSREQSNTEESVEFPEPPELLIPWLNQEKLKDHLLEEPPLLDEIPEVDPKLQEAKLKLETDFKNYLDNKWFPWAALDKKQQRIQKIYNITLGRSPTDEEIEIGMGFVKTNPWEQFAQILLMTNELIFVD